MREVDLAETIREAIVDKLGDLDRDELLAVLDELERQRASCEQSRQSIIPAPEVDPIVPDVDVEPEIDPLGPGPKRFGPGSSSPSRSRRDRITADDGRWS